RGAEPLPQVARDRGAAAARVVGRIHAGGWFAVREPRTVPAAAPADCGRESMILSRHAHLVLPFVPLLGPLAPPQEAGKPVAPTPTLVIKGGQLFDAESATAHALGQLWIADDRILGEHPADAAPPPGVKVVDASGCTLLPGLFDLHVHVSVPGGDMSGGVQLQP